MFELRYNLIATCPDEITPLLANEVRRLGGESVRPGYRLVHFCADEKLYYESHLKLRLASRLYRVIKEVPASSERIIFDKVKRIRFSELFSEKLPVKISVGAREKEPKIPTHLVGSKIREAIDDSFTHFQGTKPNHSSYEAKVSLRGFMHSNRLMLSVDTSLNSLHKRGYRVEGHPAPLKETLAAGLLSLCEYDGSIPLYDPMCGSGNIVIEGAQMAMQKSPLIHRKKGEFGFEHLKDFDSQLWRRVQEDARGGQSQPAAPIFASDISGDFIEVARKSALKARVERYIDFQVKDFFNSKKPAEKGLLIANIPYGLRIDETVSEAYLRRIGDVFKSSYSGWRCALLVPESCPYKLVGLKPTKRVSLVNGAVKVKLLIFDIY